MEMRNRNQYFSLSSLIKEQVCRESIAKVTVQHIMYECNTPNPCIFGHILEPDLTLSRCVPEWTKREQVLHTSCRVVLAEPGRLLNLCD